MELPKYLYRPSDYSIFIQVDDNQYSHKMSLGKFNIGNKYTYETLINCGFVPCEESDFPELDKKHNLYLDYMKWTTRPDGHGGAKGGTMEEFLELNK